MDLTNNRPVIVSAGLQHWYPAGVTRLQNSLVHHGYAGDMLMYNNELPPNSPTHEENPYGFKIAAIREAERRGYRVILWLDASFWCISNPHELFDIIADNGVFGFRTGYNLAQTSSDAALQWANVSRDTAELMPEVASGACGLRLDNPVGAEVWRLWQEGFERGLFRNNRLHDLADSADPRMLHARQDQTIWSLALHGSGVCPNDTDWVAYYGSGYNEKKCKFFINGL